MIGAIAGDIIGSVYEVNPIKTKEFPLFHPQACFTEDAVRNAISLGWFTRFTSSPLARPGIGPRSYFQSRMMADRSSVNQVYLFRRNFPSVVISSWLCPNRNVCALPLDKVRSKVMRRSLSFSLAYSKK